MPNPDQRVHIRYGSHAPAGPPARSKPTPAPAHTPRNSGRRQFPGALPGSLPSRVAAQHPRPGTMTPAAHAAGAQAPARRASPIPACAVCLDGSLVPAPGAYSSDVSCVMPGEPCVQPLLPAGPPAPSHPDRSPWRQRGTPVQASMMVNPFEAPEGPFHAVPTAPGAFDMPCAASEWPHPRGEPPPPPVLHSSVVAHAWLFSVQNRIAAGS